MERFVVNITPQINTITGPYIEIFARPGGPVRVPRTVADMAVESAALANRVFQPKNPKSTLDILLALQNSVLFLHDGISMTTNPNNEVTLTIDSTEFGETKYLKINPTIAKLLNVAEYIYHFRDENDVARHSGDKNVVEHNLFYTTAELVALNIANTAPNNTFRLHDQYLILDEDFHSFETGPITRLDTRLSLDVVTTMGSDSKIVILNENETRKKIIARFPIGEAIENYNEGGDEISQVINVGLEDLTRGNPDTQTINLHNGAIHVINTIIETRYLENEEIITREADFDQSGFFHLSLLFSKRVK